MTAGELLDRLEQQGLLEASVLGNLRRQVAESKKEITAESVAKLLVDKGRLTAFQAKRIMEVGASPEPDTKVTDDVGGLTPLDDDDDLTNVESVEGLTPIDDGLTPIGDDLTPVDDGLTPIGDALTPINDGLTPIGQSSAPVGDALGSVQDDLTPVESALGSSPGGGDLFGDDILGGADTLGGGSAKTDTAKKSTDSLAGKKKKKNVFDTKLIVFGGGGLIVLCLVGAVIFFMMNSADAGKLFADAEKDYQSQSYSQSIAKYDRFLKTFPDDANSSLARVRRNLARLRTRTEASQWKEALEIAKLIIPEIEKEEAFADARPELTGILPDIAAGFASRAKSTGDIAEAQEQVELANDAMTLVDNPSYIPSDLRKTVESRLQNIEDDIAIAVRNINREKKLRVALAGIQAAIDQGDTPQAYALRKALLKEYPSLENDAGLLAAVLTITKREKDAVKVEENRLTPSSDDTVSASHLRIVMAAKSGKTAPGVSNRIVFFLVRGAVYALDATDGNVLWRRFVGYETTIHPWPVSLEREADALLVDSRQDELVRVNSRTGKTVWRLALGGRFAKPRMDGERILVSMQDGGLVVVDAATGESTKRTVFPQPLRVEAVRSEQGANLYQVGEHSNLYRLNATSLECEEVFYVGHKAGSITVPPVETKNKLFVVDNAGVDYCLVHVVTLNDSEKGLHFAQKPFRLKGNVVVPPLVYQKRVLIVTDLGGVHYYEIDTANEKKPVSEIARRIAAGKTPVVGYRVVDQAQLWLADDLLSKYELQQTTGEIARKWVKDEGGGYVAPLQLIGGVLLHARRRASSNGVVVTAANRDKGTVYWRTELGVPLTGVVADAKTQKIAAFSALGDLFAIDEEIVKAGYNGKPKSPPPIGPRPSSFGPALDEIDGAMLFAGDSIRERLLSYRPGATAARPTIVELQVPEGTISGDLGVFEGGVLAPLSNGQIYLLDAKKGGALALPLEPPSEPATTTTWSNPVVVGNQFVIARSDRQLFRVGLKQQPQLHLAAETTQTLDVDVVGRMANAGDTIYGVGRGGSEEFLLVIQLPELDFKRFPLTGRVVWGPLEESGKVFVATDSDGLLCFDGGEEPVWKSPLGHGSPVGRPLTLGGNYLFASQNGTIWLVDGQSGKDLKQLEVGEPLGAGVTAFGSKLLAPGSDGVLHVLPSLSP